MILKPAQKAPEDGFALLRWTVEAVNSYFKILGKRQLWLRRDKAIRCIRHCRHFTVTWLNACVREFACLSALRDDYVVRLRRAQCLEQLRLRSFSTVETFENQIQVAHATKRSCTCVASIACLHSRTMEYSKP